jgi:hypothetical protein
MGETPRSSQKASSSSRMQRRETRAGQRVDSSAPSHQPFTSIPRMPTILSPEEAAARRDLKSQGISGSNPQPGDSGKRRTLTDRTTGRRAAVDQTGASSALPVRRREQNAARPLAQLPGTLKLPSIPREVSPREQGITGAGRAFDSGKIVEWDGEWSGDDEWERYAAEQSGRELVPVNEPAAYPLVALSPDSIPDLAAFRTSLPGVKPRRRVNTQMLIERARSPWSITRAILAVLAMIVALFATISGMGEPSQQLMQTAFAASSGSVSAPSVAGRVQPETQLLRPDLYDSTAQFKAWGNADCSAASASEVLTAWGAHGANIGKLIDAMVPDISLNGGLLRITGYQRGVSHFGYRADISKNLTYNQLVYITHTLGLPVIVNVRISYGYFHFFSGGHFLVMTDGDSQGVSIVDSSEYYIKYLPRDVLYSMFTGVTVVIVPNGYSYNVPNI